MQDAGKTKSLSDDILQQKESKHILSAKNSLPELLHKGALGKPPLLILSSAVETRQKEKNNMEKDDGKGMKKSFWRKRKYENYDEEYFHLSLKNDFPIFHFTSLQTYIEVVAEGEEEEEAKHNIRSLSSTPCRTFQPSEPHLITFKPYFVLFLIRFKSH